MGEKYVQESASIFSWVKNIFGNLPPIFSWVGPTWAHPLGPHVGPPTKWVGTPTWAQAWAQTPAPPPPPDEFSDPNLTPLPTHPGIKYVARTFAATHSSGRRLGLNRMDIQMRNERNAMAQNPIKDHNMRHMIWTIWKNMFRTLNYLDNLDTYFLGC